MKAVLHNKQLLFISGMTEARRERVATFLVGSQGSYIHSPSTLSTLPCRPEVGSGKMRPMAETFMGGYPMSMSPKVAVWYHSYSVLSTDTGGGQGRGGSGGRESINNVRQI